MSETWLYLLPAGVAAADAQWPVWLRAGDGSVRKTRLDALGATLAGPVILVLPMEMLGSCEIGPVPGKRPKPEALAYPPKSSWQRRWNRCTWFLPQLICKGTAVRWW